MKRFVVSALVAVVAILAMNGTSSAHIEVEGFVDFEPACNAISGAFDMGGPDGDGAIGSTCTHIVETGFQVERGSGRGWRLSGRIIEVHVSTWNGGGNISTVVTSTTVIDSCLSPTGREVSIDHPACQF